ncbi:polysaccharide deacetylase family protein [Spirillospora sp. CA-142024]|uniref:polysaccharide deacetylase family protein n=1 Tax=Spirillospora sp. CA-142024 TaxID=3240036 RepID=UPI003D8B200C
MENADDHRNPAAPGRRTFLKGLGLAAAGAVTLGAGADTVSGMIDSGSAPSSAMAVPIAGPWRPGHAHVEVIWGVDTSQKLVALTFDDGPMPNWTPMVHDILDAEKVKATFFLVGERLVSNARLVHGRMDRHEAGNHTWQHQDLSRLSNDRAVDQLRRAHNAIARIVGKEPRFLRPPFGHLGGTTLSAACKFEYDIALWSIKMLEKTYEHDPPQLVDYIVGNTAPGTVLLAHDTGHHDRLVAIRNLVPMIRGLRAKGYEFVTMSELTSVSQAPPRPAVPGPRRGTPPA